VCVVIFAAESLIEENQSSVECMFEHRSNSLPQKSYCSATPCIRFSGPVREHAEQPPGHWKATGRFVWKIHYKNLDLKGRGTGAGEAGLPLYTPPFKIQIVVYFQRNLRSFAC